MVLKLERFIQSKYYLLSVSIFTFLVWFINIDSFGPNPYFDVLELIGISFFILLISLLLVLFKQTIYTFPLIIHGIVMLSNQSMGMTTLNELWLIYMLLAILVVAFIYHFIHFKVTIHWGYLGSGLLIFGIAYLLSLIGYFADGKPFEMSVIMISLMGLIYFLLYIFYRSTNDQDFLSYLLKSLYYLSFVVILQTFVVLVIYFIDNQHLGSFMTILEEGIDERWGYVKDGFYVRLNVGWGLGNNIGGILAMLLPVHMYFLFKKNNLLKKILYLSLMILSLVTIVLTTSRGAYLGVAAFAVVFVVTFIKYANFDYRKYKNHLFIGFGILLLIAIPVGIYMFDFFISFMSGNSFLNGREIDWVDAWNFFLEHPIFGKSWYSDTWDLDSFRSYHNTILHTMATMGLVGLAALIFHHYQVIKLFISKWSFETLIVAGMLIITHVHGLVDNTYYAPIHMMPLLILFIGIENIGKEPIALNIKTEPVN